MTVNDLVVNYKQLDAFAFLKCYNFYESKTFKTSLIV